MWEKQGPQSHAKEVWHLVLLKDSMVSSKEMC